MHRAGKRRLDGGSVALTGRHAIACDESMCGIADRHRAGRCGAGRRGMGSGVGVARRCAGRGRRTFEKCRAFEKCHAFERAAAFSELRATTVTNNRGVSGQPRNKGRVTHSFTAQGKGDERGKFNNNAGARAESVL